jgi:hypothetical protein
MTEKPKPGSGFKNRKIDFFQRGFFIIITILFSAALFTTIKDTSAINKQNKLTRTLIDRDQHVVDSVINDIEKSLIFLGQCPLNKLISNGDTETEKNALHLLTTERHDAVAIYFANNQPMDRSILVRQPNAFQNNRPLWVCTSELLILNKAVNFRPYSGHAGLQWVDLFENLSTSIDARVSAIATTNLLSSSYMITNEGGKKYLVKKNVDKQPEYIADGIEELNVHFLFDDGTNSDQLTSINEKSLRAIQVTFTLSPVGESKEKIERRYLVPYVALGELPYPYSVEVKDAESASKIAELALNKIP